MKKRTKKIRMAVVLKVKNQGSLNIGSATAPRSYSSLDIDGRFKSRDDVKGSASGESSNEPMHISL